MIRVLIGDDHAVVRRGLRQILEETADILPVGEACSGAEVMSKVRQEKFDVVLLDIALPDRSGLEVLEQLQAVAPNLAVLILTIHPEHQYALRAIKAGACGYLTKDRAPEELIIAIRRVADGGQYLTPQLEDALVNALRRNRKESPHGALSDREFEVLVMLASGAAVGEIARRLALSPKTISTFRQRIMHKLSLKTTGDLVRYAIENQLV
jgi:two-component system, NarL family, invasion response regulator UvrY